MAHFQADGTYTRRCNDCSADELSKTLSSSIQPRKKMMGIPTQKHFCLLLTRAVAPNQLVCTFSSSRTGCFGNLTNKYISWCRRWFNTLAPRVPTFKCAMLLLRNFLLPSLCVNQCFLEICRLFKTSIDLRQWSCYPNLSGCSFLVRNLMDFVN